MYFAISLSMQSPASNWLVPIYTPEWREVLKIQCLAQECNTKTSWLVCLPPNLAVWVRALARDIVLCSWARHLALTVPLYTQVYKWVPANLMLEVTQKPEVSTSLTGHLAHIHIYLYPPRLQGQYPNFLVPSYLLSVVDLF